MAFTDSFAAERWCELSFVDQRRLLAQVIETELEGQGGLTGVVVEPGPVGRQYDLTAVAETDVGRLRVPLWSHARAMIFCDPSIHPANREQMTPLAAAREAAGHLRRRLAIPFKLESRGLTFGYSPESGVERTWVAEHSLFRRRTAVTREDRVERAGEVDVRDLLAHFYEGPSLRLVGENGDALLLPGRGDAEGRLVALCYECGRWAEGPAADCESCGSPRVETVVATRPRGR